MLRLGVLDQTPVLTGSSAVEAMKQTVELARITEKLGYSRYWVSEHHDTISLAGSSPEVLLAAIGAHTSRIRIGSGGVMLPHYSPYKVAENFRVLEALYPGRVDLGIGRAPGGMPAATRALRYGRPPEIAEAFPAALEELGGYLRPVRGTAEVRPGSGLQATPLVETSPEIWLLGSSDYSARRASELGASFSFAHFINGEGGQSAVQHYYETFRPGPLGAEPRANACVMVLCADTDEEADRLAAPLDLKLLLLEQGRFGIDITLEQALAYPYTEFERIRIRHNRKRMLVGGPEKIKTQLLEFSRSYGVEEVIVNSITPDFASRVRSYELVAGLF
ncbi:LLM class flavin-dependent oxidoreductase [Paenibacillus sp. GCM10012303]|uniref:LLM class flavin-dependent oxidoreductase n=1 Tax=Paenibacillus sp. GCM10012303 TaxID=3317340 RepID=UPI003610646E